jgi:hypothetical protein
MVDEHPLGELVFPASLDLNMDKNPPFLTVVQPHLRQQIDVAPPGCRATSDGL